VPSKVKSSKALALGVGIGVGVGVPVIIIVIVLIILIKKRNSGKSMTELTGKAGTERKNAASPNGNKVLPASETNSDSNFALANHKGSEPTLTSAAMLTHPDVTSDEIPNKKDTKPSKLK